MYCTHRHLKNHFHFFFLLRVSHLLKEYWTRKGSIFFQCWTLAKYTPEWEHFYLISNSISESSKNKCTPSWLVCELVHSFLIHSFISLYLLISNSLIYLYLLIPLHNSFNRSFTYLLVHWWINQIFHSLLFIWSFFYSHFFYQFYSFIFFVDITY